MADKHVWGDNSMESRGFFHGLPSFDFRHFLREATKKIFNLRSSQARDVVLTMNNGSISDLFAALWNLDEAHTYLKLPERLVKKDVEIEKSVEESLTYFRLGNMHLRTNKDSALFYYNMSIVYAPHPPVHIEDQVFGTNEGSETGTSEGWGRYAVLARAYKARADLLFDMGQYAAALQDVDLAQGLGSPKELDSYFRIMRSHCHHMMCQPKRGGRETFSAFSDVGLALPKLQERNPLLPSASIAVRLEYDEGGLHRHLITNRDVKQGEMLIVEKNFCSTLLPKYIRRFCVVCLRRTWTPLPCPSCTQVVFCSFICRTKALRRFHGQECSIISRINSLNIEVRAILACRILFKTTFNSLKEKSEDIKKEERKPKWWKGISPNGNFVSDNYLSVYSMTGRYVQNGMDKLTMCIEAFVLLKLLIASDRFFMDANGERIEPSLKDQIFTGSLLAHHLLNLWKTADPLFEVEILSVDCTKNPMKAIGAGVFPVTNLAMLPDDYPPCASFTHGGYLIMRATRGIKAGTVLTCRYTEEMWSHITAKEDQIFAQEVFRASNDNPKRDISDFTIDPFFLRCVRCPTGKVFLRCVECHLDYEKPTPVPDMPGRTTYDHRELLEYLYELMIRYKFNREEIVQGKRPYTIEDLDTVCEVIDCFDKHLILPHSMHLDAQLFYIILMNHFTSCVLHDGKTGPGCVIC